MIFEMSTKISTLDVQKQQQASPNLGSKTKNNHELTCKNTANLSSHKDEGISDKFSSSSHIEKDDSPSKEQWKQCEIKKIFSLYFEFGSQWKLLQTQFAGKSSNSIKNRFYTVVRTFLKMLFREHPQIKKKLPYEIPSKTILKFYEGRQQFIRFRGFGKKILKAIDYDLDSKELKKILTKNLDEIYQLYELIFPDRSQRPQNERNLKKDRQQKDLKKCMDPNKDARQKNIAITKEKGQILKTNDNYQRQQQVNEIPNNNTKRIVEDLSQRTEHVSVMFVPIISYVGLHGFNPFFSYF